MPSPEIVYGKCPLCKKEAKIEYKKLGEGSGQYECKECSRTILKYSPRITYSL